MSKLSTCPKYLLTNENPYDKSSTPFKQCTALADKKSCVVYTFSVVLQADYLKVYSWLKGLGRRTGHGLYIEDINKVFTDIVHHKWRKGDYTRENRILVKDFIIKHPVGRYFVVSRGHAFSIVDGEVVDWKDGFRRQITSAWRVYPREEKKVTK